MYSDHGQDIKTSITKSRSGHYTVVVRKQFISVSGRWAYKKLGHIAKIASLSSAQEAAREILSGKEPSHRGKVIHLDVNYSNFMKK